MLFGLPISLGTMLYQAVIFTILVFILKKLVFKKLIGILDTRKEAIVEQLRLTEDSKLKAKKNLEKSDEILHQAKIDARELIKYNEKVAKQLVQEAKEEAKHILQEAQEESSLARTSSYTQNNQIKGA